MKYNYLITIISIIALTSCASLKPKEAWLDGNWSGMGYQPEFEDGNTWSIETKLDFKHGDFKISYPSLNCKGDWELLSLSKQKAVFKEINIDNRECTNNATVVITRVDHAHISLNYFRDQDDAVFSFATLKKN